MIGLFEYLFLSLSWLLFFFFHLAGCGLLLHLLCTQTVIVDTPSATRCLSCCLPFVCVVKLSNALCLQCVRVCVFVCVCVSVGVYE